MYLILEFYCNSLIINKINRTGDPSKINKILI